MNGDIIKSLLDAQLCDIFILAGLFFLAIAVLGKISDKIEPGKSGRIISGIIGVILLITGIILIQISSEPKDDISIDMVISENQPNIVPSELTLYYESFEENGTLIIEPHMTYLDSLSKGGPVKGKSFIMTPFDWHFPEIAVIFKNNGNNPIHLKKMVVFVESSTINSEPVLIFNNNTYQELVIVNEGCGEVRHATINFSIKPYYMYEQLDPRNEDLDYSINLGTFSESISIDITPYLPPEIEFNNQFEEAVSVIGIIFYKTEKGEERSIWFKSSVTSEEIFFEPLFPDHPYSLFLESKRSGYKKDLSTPRTLSPSEVDLFLIRIASDNSSQFNLSFSFEDISGNEIHKEKIHLEIFVPNTFKTEKEY